MTLAIGNVRQIRCRPKQTGLALWLILICLMLMVSPVWVTRTSPMTANQRAMQQTQAALALAQQALLGYALQTLIPSPPKACNSNCKRPGDLPCPDRNNDGIAESSCQTVGSRLGRLPWRTLGIGDVRDASGARLWYAVSDAYKNNVRKLPLNLDTPGSWSLATPAGLTWDATTGSGLVAVLIAPMQPLQRTDGWLQQRDAASVAEPKHYLDRWADDDNAMATEWTQHGFVMAPSSQRFNDVVWPVTASRMHQAMQAQVLAELSNLLDCLPADCGRYPQAAALTDTGCLGTGSVPTGQCLPATTALGRVPSPVGSVWPSAVQEALSGDAQHHWFQQNGWREQVFYQRTAQGFRLLLSGEALTGQSRTSLENKQHAEHYLEAATFKTLGLTQAGAQMQTPNDAVRTWP